MCRVKFNFIHARSFTFWQESLISYSMRHITTVVIVINNILFIYFSFNSCCYEYNNIYISTYVCYIVSSSYKLSVTRHLIVGLLVSWVI